MTSVTSTVPELFSSSDLFLLFSTCSQGDIISYKKENLNISPITCQLQNFCEHYKTCLSVYTHTFVLLHKLRYCRMYCFANGLVCVCSECAFYGPRE